MRIVTGPLLWGMPQYEINAPHVVGEVIDGEAIIMDLRSGHYYSCLNIGAAIWRGVEMRSDIGTLTGLLCGRFPNSATVIGRDVSVFVAQLLELELIRQIDGSPDVPEPSADPLVDVENYTRPELHVYTDMKTLLLLDPVHEAADAGWPAAKAKS